MEAEGLEGSIYHQDSAFYQADDWNRLSPPKVCWKLHKVRNDHFSLIKAF